MNHDFDLIIVGAGPAGAMMALAAARGGLSVLLLDRAHFPRDKICGDLVPFDAIPLLREHGLRDAVEQLPRARADHLVVYAGARRLRVPSPPDGLLVCRRLDLDNALFQAARARVETGEGHRVTDVLRGDGGRVCGVRGETSRGRAFRVTARVVAGADGFKSVIARAVGAYARQPEHWAVATRAYYRGVGGVFEGPGRAVEIDFFAERAPAYLWIFPVDDDTVNVGVGRVVGRAQESSSLRALHERLIRSRWYAPRFAAAEQLTPIQGWNLPLASTRRAMHGDGFILAGDAAGLIDPLWGHGINSAMISGQIAGELLPAVCRAGDYSAAALRRYDDAVWSRLGPGFARARACRSECVEGPERGEWAPLGRLRERCFGGAGELAPRDAPTR